jgi:hypothetical protein
MRHTQGEWELVEITGGHQCVSGGIGIMVLKHDGSAEAQANARLMAAAEKLLEAAKNVIWKLGHNGDPNYNPGPVKISRLDVTIRELELAIAKAEGDDR